jgi:hypothetical protein
MFKYMGQYITTIYGNNQDFYYSMKFTMKSFKKKIGSHFSFRDYSV